MIRVTLFVVSALLIQLSASEPEISPASKTIDINEGGSYTIQYIENNTTDIRRCFYLSETISGSFDVVKPETNDTKYTPMLRSNTIAEFGQSGLCRIDVRNVDEDGPKSWTLIAYDAASEKNVSAEIAVNFYFDANLLQSRVIVTETGSFIQHLSPAATLQLTKCELSFENTTLNLLSSRSISTKEDNHILKRLFSLGRDKCGFKLINVTSDDPREITITAVDSNNKSYRASFIVTILTQGSKYKSQEVTLGETVYISCGLQLPDDQYFCDLYDPKGNLVQSAQRCSLTLDMVTANHIGMWKCRIGVPYLMETPVYEVELIQKESENITTWVEDTTDYVNIGCRFNNYDRLTSGSTYCRMIAPNQDIFKIQSGAASSRYTTLTTDLTAYTCGMEIEKPLEDFERGVWKCEIYLINDMVGGFIRVGIDENVTLDYEKHLQKTIKLDEAFQVECKVPYSTKYCHIKAPNGTIYPTNNVYKTYLGECALSVTKSVESDNGTWTCSFARETGYPDEEIYLEVTIADVLIYYEEAEVTKGNDAELYCNSGGIPLQYCRFISPQGNAYHLESNESDTGITYTGAGLTEGECGIKISNVNNSHEGNWTCITRLGYNFKQNEISAVIHLEVADDSSIATAVAASLGSVGGVLLVVSGYVVYKIKQRRSNRSDVATAPVGFLHSGSVRSNGSGSSNGSGTVIIPADANYNTVNNNNK